MATLKEMFEAHTADIVEATELLKELSDREGLYVWEKFTAQNGDSLGYVTADDEASYPNGGELDGYWYERYESLIYTYDEEVITEGSASTEPEGSLHFII